jgi:excisionase family DNA binding protein
MGRPRKQISFAELPDHFDVKILARFLRKRSDNIYRMCRSGEIPCHRIGRSFLIVRNEFGRAWLRGMVTRLNA